MRRSSSMLTQLDYATRGYHVAVDAVRMSLLGLGSTRTAYVDYCTQTFTFEAPIEARWQATAGLDRVIDIQRRLHTNHLAADLRALGCAVDNLMPASLVGVEQALGWMYVVERARRMNGLLRRHLLRRMPSVMAIAGTYLLASSPLGMRWEQLGATLDHVARSQAIAVQIINAAHRAFRHLRKIQQAASRRQELSRAS